MEEETVRKLFLFLAVAMIIVGTGCEKSTVETESSAPQSSESASCAASDSSGSSSEQESEMSAEEQLPQSRPDEQNGSNLEDKRIVHTDGSYTEPEIFVDDEILDYQQKEYDFTEYCKTQMNKDIYGGYSYKSSGDGIILYYLDLEQVRATANTYRPGWNGSTTQYVDDPIRIEYKQADYSMTFLEQVEREMQSIVFELNLDDPQTHIFGNRVSVTVSNNEDKETLRTFLKSYKNKDCIEKVHNASSVILPVT